MKRRAYLRAVGAVGVGTLSGCLVLGSESEAEYDVGMSTRDFRPEVIEVEVGETVVWRNTSSHAHTVTAYKDQTPEEAEYWATGDFDTEQSARDAWTNNTGGALYQSDQYEHTFEVPGDHHYFCVPHEPGGMVGTVVVTE